MNTRLVRRKITVCLRCAVRSKRRALKLAFIHISMAKERRDSTHESTSGRGRRWRDSATKNTQNWGESEFHSNRREFEELEGADGELFKERGERSKRKGRQ